MKQLLEELFDTYYRDVYGYLYSLCRDPFLTEDLTSEVFLEVVRSISGFRHESDIKTWLFSIARHRWASWLRKQSREVPTMSIHELCDTDALGTGPEPKDLLALLEQFLETEPELTRKVVRLRLEGYSHHEIGAACGIAENSARVIWFRAKNKIKKLLQEEGSMQ